MTATSPIYTATLATTGSPRLHGLAPIRYVGLADTARLIRSALATRWPGVRFYVRSSSYSMGSSVHVSYAGRTGYATLTACHCTDGPTVSDAYGSNQCRVCGYMGRLEPIYAPGAPTQAEVEELVRPFASHGFDGSIDLQYSFEAWLNPDGSASFAATSGTAGSMGSVPESFGSRRHPSAILVRFGAGYVFVDPEAPYDTTPDGRAALERRRERTRARRPRVIA